jgi:hypothetical protein
MKQFINKKFIEYLGNDIYSIYLTKFLYTTRNKYCDYIIKNKTDLLNIDIKKEYIIYYNYDYYLYKIHIFDNNDFCKYQTNSQRLFKIILSSELYYDLKFIEIDNKQDIINKINNITPSKNIPRNDPIYNILIKPYLDKDFIILMNKDTVNLPIMFDNIYFDNIYKINLQYFIIKCDDDGYYFNLKLIDTYLLEINDYQLLYLKNQPYDNYKKSFIYKKIDVNKMCSYQSDFFFYHCLNFDTCFSNIKI